jgi:hypothetical protein
MPELDEPCGDDGHASADFLSVTRPAGHPSCLSFCERHQAVGLRSDRPSEPPVHWSGRAQRPHPDRDALVCAATPASGVSPLVATTGQGAQDADEHRPVPAGVSGPPAETATRLCLEKPDVRIDLGMVVRDVGLPRRSLLRSARGHAGNPTTRAAGAGRETRPDLPWPGRPPMPMGVARSRGSNIGPSDTRT